MSNTTTEEPTVMEDEQHEASSVDQPPGPCADQPLTARIEALLLSTDKPMSDGKIAELLQVSLEQGGTKPVREAIDELNEHYEQSGRSFRIESLAGGRQILTLPAFGSILHRLHQDRMATRLSPAAMETLAIVAYRQPILRTGVEQIRGVACGEMLRGLMERRLVKIVGRAEELGRPMLYGTTREFLRIFGLSNLDDLPNAKDLREAAEKINKTRPQEVEVATEESTETQSNAEPPDPPASAEAEKVENEDKP